MKKILDWLLPFIFILVFIYGRIVCYGPMNDSVAVQDSESYFAAAEKAAFTLDFFQQSRSITYPLLILISNPTERRPLSAIRQ